MISCGSSFSKQSQNVYEVRLLKDHRGVDLISDALPFGRLWYDTPDNAIGYAMHNSRSSCCKCNRKIREFCV
jgi:hypothetical protein